MVLAVLIKHTNVFAKVGDESKCVRATAQW